MATSGDPASIVRWPPAPSPGGVIGLVAVIFCLFFASLSTFSIVGVTSLTLPRIVAFVLLIVFLILAASFGYLLYGYATMRYELTTTQLTIRWAKKSHVIPIESVQEIVPAVERLDPNPPGWQHFWPGYYVGEQATLAGLVTIVATLRARRQLLLVTRDYQFAISPERPVLFLEAFAQLRGARVDESLRAAAEWQPATLTARFVEAGWTTPYPAASAGMVDPTLSDERRALNASPEGHQSSALPRLWSDSLSSGLLIAALLMNVAITLFLVLRYDSIPQTIAIHWNTRGMADRFAPARQIWMIPLITWLVTIANVAFAWVVDRIDRFAARFLLASSLAVEVAALVALYWMIL